MAITEIERAAAETWPVSDIRCEAGWLLRHCGLLSAKRSNSALPPGEVTGLETAVERVERYYAERNATPIVQVSPLHRHAELDAFLSERGYRVVTPTEVMCVDVARIAETSPRIEVRLDAAVLPSWLPAVEAVGGRVMPSLDRMREPVRFARAVHGGTPIGVGVFAVAGDWCGVYGMVTDPRWRRRGVATAILRAGASWARLAGAKALFLQVESGNDGARSVYSGLGFRVTHRYQYRVRNA